MTRRSLKVALMAVLVAAPLSIAGPAAHADCTDLGGNGTLCTGGDPTTGVFGVTLNGPQGLHLCLVIQSACP
jgi:hypothetical protein